MHTTLNKLMSLLTWALPVKKGSVGGNKDKLYRGMPNLNLNEQQIDDLVAYLTTLK